MGWLTINGGERDGNPTVRGVKTLRGTERQVEERQFNRDEPTVKRDARAEGTLTGRCLAAGAGSTDGLDVNPQPRGSERRTDTAW